MRIVVRDRRIWNGIWKMTAKMWGGNWGGCCLCNTHLSRMALERHIAATCSECRVSVWMTMPTQCFYKHHLQVEGLVVAIPCRFDSCLGHQTAKGLTAKRCESFFVSGCGFATFLPLLLVLQGRCEGHLRRRPTGRYRRLRRSRKGLLCKRSTASTTFGFASAESPSDVRWGLPTTTKRRRSKRRSMSTCHESTWV